MKRVALVLLVAACGGQLPTPNADLVADTTIGKNRCQVGKENDRPFVVEWDPTDFATFESKAKRDLVFLKIDGCNMKVLDCRDDGIAAKYGSYDAPQWTSGVVESFEIKNEGDLYAKLPFGATTLSGTVRGGNSLNLKYFVSGSRPALRSMVYRNDIASNPLCASATHFAAGYDLGAFDLSTTGSANASAQVKAPTVSGGGNYAHSEGHMRGAGELADCTKSSAMELARCRVPIRLSLRAIADGANPGSPASTQTSNNALPPGITEDFMALMQSSQRKMALKDGPGCLADLDRAEAMRNNTMHNLDMVRATCEMLVGKCDDGRKRYRGFLERTAPQLTPEQIDQAALQQATTYCAGKEKTPLERATAANRELVDALHKKDVTRCNEQGKIMLEACGKITVESERRSVCDGQRYATECIAKNENGDCALGKKLWEQYVNDTYATNTQDMRDKTIASYACPAFTTKPPPNKKKIPKKKP